MMRYVFNPTVASNKAEAVVKKKRVHFVETREKSKLIPVPATNSVIHIPRSLVLNIKHTSILTHLTNTLAFILSNTDRRSM